MTVARRAAGMYASGVDDVVSYVFGLLLSFGYVPCVSGRDVLVQTGSSKSYVQLDVHGIFTEHTENISFSVRAAHDAHVRLSERRFDWKTQSYEVVLGGWNNTRSVIRACEQCDSVTSTHHSPLSPDEFRAFWFSWKDGRITVGHERDIGARKFLSWTPIEPYRVRYLAVSTGWNAIGSWRFNVLDGHFGQWSSWSLCSRGCGGGVQSRVRYCSVVLLGRPCYGLSEDKRVCLGNLCPVDGSWSEWNAWNPCSTTCGRGHHYRTRRCVNPAPSRGGRECDGSDWQGRSCNLRPCPECPGNRWGTICEHACPGCRGLCTRAEGVCSYGCIPGWRGVDCTNPCPSGWYGENCASRCGSCLRDRACDATNGVCLDCSAGWVGPTCREECPDHTWGQNCANTCDTCRGRLPCDKVNGGCTLGCEPGYVGVLCDSICEPGMWGDQCSRRCGDCYEGRACKSDSGYCPETNTTDGGKLRVEVLCAPGYVGLRCDEACQGGFWGSKCLDRCGSCQSGYTCSPVSGACPSGCAPGHRGLTCREPCRSGSWGGECASRCGHCRDDEACNAITGYCRTDPDGLPLCSSGYIGLRCTEGCPAGFWSLNCAAKCGQCRLGKPCVAYSGSCEDGCDPGWTGSPCDRPCENGLYGVDCEGVCGRCLYSMMCHKVTGFCERPPTTDGVTGDGVTSPDLGENSSSPNAGPSTSSPLTGVCFPGYTGPRCDVTCSAGSWGAGCASACGSCASEAEACHFESGLCPGDCRSGYVGARCLQSCPDGTWGFRCESKCGNCAEGSTCDKESGYCLLDTTIPSVTSGTAISDSSSTERFVTEAPVLCADGYRGVRCDEVCPLGKFGRRCWLSCGSCVNSSGCDNVDGHCRGGCEPGFSGNGCNDACPEGTFGTGCAGNCSQCPDSRCDALTGSCENSNCDPGWLGSRCDLPCADGFWGARCSLRCGRCRYGRPCHHVVGVCEGGCNDGFTGLACVVFNSTYAPWSAWQACSGTCGNGTRFRERECQRRPNGSRTEDDLTDFVVLPCSGPNTSAEACETGINCPIDGNFSNWMDWSTCSTQCGDGNRTRIRFCTNPVPEFGGLNCSGAWRDVARCFLRHCPVDGGFSEWLEWTKCSVTCGNKGGLQMRQRLCNNPVPQYGGVCNDLDVDNRTCGETVCPIPTRPVKSNEPTEAPGAVGIGMIGLSLLFVLVAALVILDATSLGRHIRFLKRNIRDFRRGIAARRKQKKAGSNSAGTGVAADERTRRSARASTSARGSTASVVSSRRCERSSGPVESRTTDGREHRAARAKQNDLNRERDHAHEAFKRYANMKMNKSRI